jgi:hypothetical protein
MYRPLIQCPGCRRHVQLIETACPFCEGALAESDRAHRAPDTTRRLTRAAAFVFGASVATTAIIGCGDDETETESTSSSTNAGGFAAAYGAPGGFGSSTGGEGGEGGDSSAGGLAPMYGAPGGFGGDPGGAGGAGGN